MLHAIPLLIFPFLVCLCCIQIKLKCPKKTPNFYWTPVQSKLKLLFSCCSKGNHNSTSIHQSASWRLNLQTLHLPLACKSKDKSHVPAHLIRIQFLRSKCGHVVWGVVCPNLVRSWEQSQVVWPIELFATNHRPQATQHAVEPSWVTLIKI